MKTQAGTKAATSHRRVQERDVRGSLHMHTKASDGADTLPVMVEAAHAKGLAYVAITDHGGHLLRQTKQGKPRLKRQKEVIRATRDEYPNMHIYHGAEIDISEDGSLDFPDHLIDQLDVCVASVHSSYDLSEDVQTARIVKAIRHPRVRILAHPLGQYRGVRSAMKYDFEQVARAAAAHDVALEINGKPERMDLPPDYVKRGSRAGVRFVVSADAHSASDHDNIANAIRIAQESKLSADSIVNTAPVKKFGSWLDT